MADIPDFEIPGFDPKKLTKLLLLSQALGVHAAKGVGEAASDVLGMGSISDILNELIKSIFGSDILSKVIDAVTNKENFDKVSEVVADIFRQTFSDPLIAEVAETLGAVVTTPFVSVLEQYADDPSKSPEDFANAFHGAIALMNILPMITSFFETGVFGTQLGPISQQIQGLYWNLGLGFLGWQTLAPQLSAGLQPKLERHFKKVYRSNRFSAAEYLALYNLGDIDRGQLQRFLAEEGWADETLSSFIEFSQRALSRSDMEMLFKKGKLTREEVERELIKEGNNPRFVPTIAEEIINTSPDDSKSASLATIKSAYKKDLIPRAEFTDMMRALGYDSDAINLEIAVIEYDKKTKIRELTLSQYKAGYIQGVINRVELLVDLARLDYGPAQTEVIIKTWDAEKRPKLIRLNKSTIVSAMKAGVYDSNLAQLKLVEIGYDTDAARVVVETTLEQMRVVFRDMSIGNIIKARTVGAITDSEFNERLKIAKVPETDFGVYLAIAKAEQPKLLGIAEIQQAYLYGIVDRATALKLLTEFDTNPEHNRVRLETWQAQRTGFNFAPTAGMLTLWYRQGLLSPSQLVQRLVQVGFKQADAELIRKSADLAIPRELSASEVQELFITQVVNRGRAIELLQKTGLTAANSQDVVKAWEQAAALSVPQPTITQLTQAYQREQLTEREFIDALKARGLPQKLVQFYLNLAQTETIEADKELSKSDITGLYKDALFTYDEALERLVNLGYSIEDSERLLLRARPPLDETQLSYQFIAGAITPDDFSYGVLRAGYTDAEVEEYIINLSGG